MTSELLFELYNAPSVTYGIDSLFAFSRHAHKDGLSISLGHNASTIIPVVNGRGDISRAKRLVGIQLHQLTRAGFPLEGNKLLSSCRSSLSSSTHPSRSKSPTRSSQWALV